MALDDDDEESLLLSGGGGIHSAGGELLHSRLQLHHTPDRYIVSAAPSAGSDGSHRVLVVDRVTHDLSIADRSSVHFDRVSKTEELAGILGVADLVSGPYLVVARRRRKLGDLSFRNHGVFELSSADLIPFARSDNHLTARQQQENRTFVSMMTQVRDRVEIELVLRTPRDHKADI